MIDPAVPWVLLRVRDQLFGVPASHIREMAEMPPVTHVPNMPEYVMGLVSLRGQVTPVIDLRRRLGVVTAEEDIKRLIEGLEAAEAEHRRLAEALESAVQDERTGSIDPAACSMHEWLDTLQTKNPLVRLHLKKLEEPHANLHAAAARVVQTAAAGPSQARAALRRFQEKELAAFTRLLPQVRERLVHAHRQIVVVLTLDNQALGAAVDEVESIERLKNGSVEELPANLRSMKRSLTKIVGRRTRDDEIVLILEVEELFHGNGQVPIHGDWMKQAESTPASAPERAPATATAASAGIVEMASAAVPVRAVSDLPTDRAASSVTRAEGQDDGAWCGDPNGPWVRLEEGPIVQPGVAWEMDEAETSDSPGSSLR
jgi:chemotaxis signal transduction protein